MVSLLLKCHVISFVDFWNAYVVLQHKECTFSVHREHNVFYSFKYYSYVECGTKITGILGYLHMEGLLSYPYSCEGESEVGV